MACASSLRYHLLRHKKEFKYRCSHCGKGYIAEFALAGHMASKHGQSREYTCHICSKSFSYKQTLVRHMRNTHFKIK